MIVVAVKIVEMQYRPDTTLHQGKPQKLTLHGSALYSLWVCSASALSLLRVKSGSPLADSK